MLGIVKRVRVEFAPLQPLLEGLVNHVCNATSYGITPKSVRDQQYHLSTNHTYTYFGFIE
jgi:hypothetical protein